MPDPTDDSSGRPDCPATDAEIDRHAAEAERVIELLSARRSTGQTDLDQRVAASGTLARLAQVDPATVEEFLSVLVEELRRETDSGGSDEARDSREKLQTVRANLIETVSHLIINTSETTVGQEGFTAFLGAVSTTLDDGTLRVATHALFASADERARELATVADLLDELLTYPDVVVQTWIAGTVGRVAAAYPDAVAATAVNLRRLLTHEHSTVQHNAVEALATMVGSRPDVVVPAADTLRGLLNHEEVALQHNAAGLLYVLAEHQPEAVTPAVEELQNLRTHDDDAVRRIATATLARLADERLDATTDSKSK